MVGGSGADLLTFSNVVGNTSIKGFGSSDDSANDTVVLRPPRTDINVDFAAGLILCLLPKVQPTQLLQLQAGNDTVVAALTLAKQLD